MAPAGISMGLVEHKQHDNSLWPGVSHSATVNDFDDVTTDAQNTLLGLPETDDDCSVVSVASFVKPSQSSRTSLEHEVRRLSVEEIVSTLVLDEAISSAIPKALMKMSSNWLHRHLTWFLARYAIELHFSAKNRLQQSAAALVTRNKACIARYVCGRLDPAQASRRLEMNSLRAESSHSQGNSERHPLSHVADTPASVTNQATQKEHRSIVSDKQDDVSDDYHTFQEDRQFMIHSSAMAHLRENLTHFVVLPPAFEAETPGIGDKGIFELQSSITNDNTDDDIMLSIASLYADEMKMSAD